MPKPHVLPPLVVFLLFLAAAGARAQPQGMAAGAADPVTLAVSRTAKPGCEGNLEQSVRELLIARTGTEGPSGTKIIRPAPPHDRRFQIFFTFADQARLENWRRSPEARQWQERLDPLTDGPAVEQVATGTEAWFLSPDAAPVQPDPGKRVVVTWLSVFPLVLGITTLTGPYLIGAPPVVRTLVMTMIMVPTMSLVAVPQMSRLFEPWLYPRPDRCAPEG